MSNDRKALSGSVAYRSRRATRSSGFIPPVSGLSSALSKVAWILALVLFRGLARARSTN